MTDLGHAILAGLDLPTNGSDGRVTALDRLEAAALTTTQLKALPPPESLIVDYLVRDSLATLYGPSGDGKSFVAIDWALHIATGSWWNGRAIHPGPVVYVVAEGGRGAGRRVAAWQQHANLYDLDRFEPVTWLPMSVGLFDRQEVAALCRFIETRQPALVVVDTFARCILGAEENSARDVGIVIDNLDQIRRASGACVLNIHHSGKDGSAGSRGSSALRGAMDTEIEVTAADRRITLRVKKQKDGAQAPPFALDRIDVADSCVLVPASHTRDDLPAGALETLEALRNVQVPGGVSATVWKAAADVADRTFFDRRARLVASGLVVNEGSDKRPLYVVREVEE